MSNPSKIHAGAGTLTLNPESSPIDLGLTQDGATLTYSAELESIMTDQYLSPVGYYVPGEECTFETLLTEGSADIVRYALGATDQTVSTQSADASNKGYSQIAFGGNSTLTDYVLEYKAKKRTNSNLYVIIRLHLVNISPNIELAYKKDGVSVYKITFKAKADTTKDAGQQLGYYREETADVTGTTPTLAVSSTDPADEDADVAVTESIAIVFNRNVHPSSITNGNFVLMDDSGNLVTTTVAFTGTAGTNVTVTPSANLSATTNYVLMISENVRALDDYTKMSASVPIYFTTV